MPEKSVVGEERRKKIKKNSQTQMFNERRKHSFTELEKECSILGNPAKTR